MPCWTRPSKRNSIYCSLAIRISGISRISRAASWPLSSSPPITGRTCGERRRELQRPLILCKPGRSLESMSRRCSPLGPDRAVEARGQIRRQTSQVDLVIGISLEVPGGTGFPQADSGPHPISKCRTQLPDGALSARSLTGTGFQRWKTKAPTGSGIRLGNNAP